MPDCIRRRGQRKGPRWDTTLTLSRWRLGKFPSSKSTSNLKKRERIPTYQSIRKRKGQEIKGGENDVLPVKTKKHGREKAHSL